MCQSVNPDRNGTNMSGLDYMMAHVESVGGNGAVVMLSRVQLLVSCTGTFVII